MLKSNPGKTKVLHFIPHFMKQPYFGDSITFAGTEINITKKARNLGVVMDNNLSCLVATSMKFVRNLLLP